jgi:ribosomal protein S12 methylthiotransferase accessory factor
MGEVNQSFQFDVPPERMEYVRRGSMQAQTLKWITGASTSREPYLLPRPGAPRSIRDLPSFERASIDAAVRHCVDRLAAHGHDVIVHDFDRLELPLACVRVVAPGLRHFWNRRGPGRLYDVPVKMGWLAKPLSEDELNPVNFFM